MIITIFKFVLIRDMHNAKIFLKYSRSPFQFPNRRWTSVACTTPLPGNSLRPGGLLSLWHLPTPLILHFIALSLLRRGGLCGPRLSAHFRIFSHFRIFTRLLEISRIFIFHFHFPAFSFIHIFFFFLFISNFPQFPAVFRVIPHISPSFPPAKNGWAIVTTSMEILDTLS